MKVTDRTIKVLEFLQVNRLTTIAILVEKMNLDERAIRYELNNIDFYLSLFKFNPIVKKTRGEIQVNPDDLKTVIHSLEDIVITSSEERKKYISYLLLLNGEINLSKLTIKFDVSRNTVRNDVMQAEDELRNIGFHIEKHQLHGDEMCIRTQLANTFVESYRILFQSKIDIGYNINVVEQSLIEEFGTQERESINAKIDLMDENMAGLDRVKAYVMVMIQRIKRGKIIHSTKEAKPYLQKTKIYKYLMNNKSVFEKHYKLEIPDIEILALTNRFHCEMKQFQNPIVFESLIQSKTFVERLVRTVGSELKIPMNEDNILINGLLEHFRTTIYRVKNKIMVEDIVYYDAIQAYRDLFYIVKRNLSEFEDLIKEELTKEEVALVSVHFLGAIKRFKDVTAREKRIILLCGSGYGTSLVVKNLIETNYEVSVLDTISLYQLANYPLDNIDFVISTIKVDYKIEQLSKVPIIKISPFLAFDDEVLLEQFHIQRKRKTYGDQMDEIFEIVEKNVSPQQLCTIKNEIQLVFQEDKKSNQQSLFHFLTKQDIYMTDKIDEWQNALSIGGNYLIDNGYIDVGYLEEIFNVVKTYGAYFVIRNQIAMPHGQINDFVKKDGMHVMYIKEGVMFPDGRVVKIIFFLAASNKDILLNTVLRISELSHCEELHKSIDECKTKEEVIDVLLHLDKGRVKWKIC